MSDEDAGMFTKSYLTDVCISLVDKCILFNVIFMYAFIFIIDYSAIVLIENFSVGHTYFQITQINIDQRSDRHVVLMCNLTFCPLSIFFCNITCII